MRGRPLVKLLSDLLSSLFPTVTFAGSLLITPPYVPFGIRRFGNANALPRIFWICRHSLGIRGIRLSKRLAAPDCVIFSSSRVCCWPSAMPDCFQLPVSQDYRVSHLFSSTVSSRFVVCGGASILRCLLLGSSCLLWNSIPASPSCIF